MKFVFLVIVFCFGILNAQEFNEADPGLQIGENSTFESDVADTTNAHQNSQRTYGKVPSANCPECAFAQQIRAHELYAVENGGTGESISGTGSPGDTSKEQK